MADINIPGPYDETTVTESVTAELPDALEISVSDTVTVGESVTTGGFEWYISVYDEVTVTESVSGLSMRIYTDPRPEFSPKWPTWELDAQFNTYMLLEERLPGRQIESRLGSQLVKFQMPGRYLEGSISESPILSLDQVTPAYSIAGWFGCILEAKTPHWEIDLSLIGYDVLRLKETVAGWTVDAAMLVETDLTLDSKTPRWKLEGSVGRDNIASLEGNLSFWTIEATVLSGKLVELDGKTPVWVLEASTYSGDMTLDVSMPARVMAAIGTGDDYGGGKDTGDITDQSRFVGYVLEHGG